MNEHDDIQTSPYQSPMYNFGSSIMHLTNPQAELQKMELMFKGIRIDAQGNEVSTGYPLMNELGIGQVLGTIQSIVNQVTVMSTLNKNEIPMIVDFLADTLAKDLMVNRINYAINSQAARDKIYFTAITTSFITMKRAFDEGISDKKFWRGSVQEINTRVENSQKKSGLMNSLNPWRKEN